MITCVYKRESDYGAEVEGFLGELERKIGKDKLEVLEPESIDGEIFARAHDITSYPTIVATREDGGVVQSWVGLPLPRVEDVSYFANL